MRDKINPAPVHVITACCNAANTFPVWHNIKKALWNHNQLHTSLWQAWNVSYPTDFSVSWHCFVCWVLASKGCQDYGWHHVWVSRQVTSLCGGLEVLLCSSSQSLRKINKIVWLYKENNSWSQFCVVSVSEVLSCLSLEYTSWLRWIQVKRWL